MSLKNQIQLDAIDQRILTILIDDGRIRLSELAGQVAMSAPSVTERVRRLQDRGVLHRFTIELDAGLLGYALQAIVRIKPRSGQLKQVEKMITDQPRFIACDRVTGDDCYVAKLMLKTVDELDPLLEPFHECAETNTSIVKSSLIKRRAPPLS